MPVTIRDVAQRLNLSVTTVSRALAGYDDVAEATRQRVIQAAREMGYVPTHAARQLRRQRTETISLVFPTLGSRFSDPFFSEFMAGVGDEASQRSYDLLVSVAAQGEAEEATYHRLVQSRRVDGFVLVRTRVDDWRLRFLAENGVPLVSFGRSQSAPESPHIEVDGRGGMLAVVRHVASTGRSRIAFIGAPDDLTFGRERLAGYRDGLVSAGLAYDPALVATGDLTRDGAYRVASEMLDRSPAPDAIIGVNDLSALGAMRAVQERGLTVGSDLAIAGFDGTEAGEHSNPPLTTAAQPVYQIARDLCSMLIQLVEGEPLEQAQRLVSPKLILRQSTADASVTP